MATRKKKKPDFKLEEVELSSLRPHPRNYRDHPEEELRHLERSLLEHGLYKNVVVAKDGTILAGHAVVEALLRLGFSTVPVVRLDVEPESKAALKVLAGDNEISHLAMPDDRALSELLKEIGEVDFDDLLGTGFDEIMLANLVFVTRPEREIEDFDAAKEWVGLPLYEETEKPLKLVVNFRNRMDFEEFISFLGLRPRRQERRTYSVWWPAKEPDDLKSLKFEG